MGQQLEVTDFAADGIDVSLDQVGRDRDDLALGRCYAIRYAGRIGGVGAGSRNICGWSRGRFTVVSRCSWFGCLRGRIVEEDRWFAGIAVVVVPQHQQ
ncbi:hypothetical protein D3C84_1088460 [compost metagenome]